MFSIITPLHNKEKHIRHTIESVLNQSFKDLELIVVNDASTDNSVSIVQSYKDDRVRIETIEHAGVSGARNIGIELAKYEWIAFLDADDWWSPDYLKVLSKAIANYPKQRFFATGQILHTEQGTTKRFVNLSDSSQSIELLDYVCHFAKFASPCQTSCACISKGLFEKVGMFTKGISKYEDIELWLRLGVEAPLVFVNSHLSHYRQTVSDSLSSKKWAPKEAKMFLQNIQELAQNARTSEQKKCLTQVYDRMLRTIGVHEFHRYSADEIDDMVNFVRHHFSMRHYIQILFYKYLSFIMRLKFMMKMYHSVTSPIRSIRRALA
ncbi:MAG: glycosyltransferase [Chloroflexota bacterium]